MVLLGLVEEVFKDDQLNLLYIKILLAILSYEELFLKKLLTEHTRRVFLQRVLLLGCRVFVRDFSSDGFIQVDLAVQLVPPCWRVRVFEVGHEYLYRSALYTSFLLET